MIIRKQVAPATATVSIATGGVTIPAGTRVGDYNEAVFLTLAAARAEPKTFWGRVGWWSRLYVGGPKLFLTPVAPPDRVPVREHLPS